MANERLRNYAKEKGVLLWEIADACGIADTTFSRVLRKELPEKRVNRLCSTIDEIAARKGAQNEE